MLYTFDTRKTFRRCSLVSIVDCQFIQNTSSFELIRLRQAAIIERNLFFANATRDTVLEIGELALEDVQSKVEANVFVANRSRSIILPFSNEKELPIRFNTFFQNEGTILKKQQNAPVSLAANLIADFAEAPFEVCRWSGEEPEGEIIVSRGHNLFFRGSYNCGIIHEDDIVLEDNTEDTWRDIIHMPNTLDPEWNGIIELTDESLAKNAIPSEDPLYETAGLDTLGHLRPERDEGQCDIGALEMDSTPPPDPEQGIGGSSGLGGMNGSGGMELLAGSGGSLMEGGTGGEPFFEEPPPLGGGFIQGGEDGAGGEASDNGPIGGEQSAGRQSEGGLSTGGYADGNPGGEQTHGGQAQGGQISGEPSGGAHDEPPQGGSNTYDPGGPSDPSSKSKTGCQCSIKGLASSSLPHHTWLWLSLSALWFGSRKKRHPN